mgnify:CR=1 FL=1
MAFLEAFYTQFVPIFLFTVMVAMGLSLTVAVGGGESSTGRFDRLNGSGSSSTNSSDNEPAELTYVDMDTFLACRSQAAR